MSLRESQVVVGDTMSLTEELSVPSARHSKGHDTALQRAYASQDLLQNAKRNNYNKLPRDSS